MRQLSNTSFAHDALLRNYSVLAMQLLARPGRHSYGGHVAMPRLGRSGHRQLERESHFGDQAIFIKAKMPPLRLMSRPS